MQKEILSEIILNLLKVLTHCFLISRETLFPITFPHTPTETQITYAFSNTTNIVTLNVIFAQNQVNCLEIVSEGY